MGSLFIRFWPVFVPLLLYIVWMWWRIRKAKKKGEEVPRIKDGPWFWAVLSALLIAIGLFLFLGMTQQENAGASYTATKYKDGKLIKGGVE